MPSLPTTIFILYNRPVATIAGSQMNVICRAVLLVVSLSLGATVANAQSSGHSSDHLVVVPADCPEFGANVTEIINFHGKPALKLTTDGSNRVGFDVLVDTREIAHGQLPNVPIPQVMPVGTLQFNISSSSPTPYVVNIFNFNGYCNTLDAFVPVPHSGVMTIPWLPAQWALTPMLETLDPAV